MHFCFKSSLLVAFEMDLKFPHFLILHGRAVADFDGSCAAHVQADGRSEDMA